jgi:hypothetical protein
MVRLAAGRKGLDDDHATATARTRMRGGRRLVGTAVVVREGLRFWHGEQLARSRKVFRARRLGQKSVVTNAMEALRQDVDEEAADNAAPSSSVKRCGHERAYLCFMRGSRSRRRQLSILRLQSRFIFGNKRTNLIGHVQKLQPLLFI